MNTFPENPAVAVVVPCYNVESCVERALNSASGQTFGDYRIFAVDDGSTDETPQILERFKACQILRLPKRSGAGAARNHAIRASSSPYIAFLDADDQWLPEKLERQIELLEKERDLGLVCSYCRPGEARDDEMPTDQRPSEPLMGRLFARLVRECFVYTPTVVLRRECLKDAGLFNESLVVSEDFNLWLRIAARWKIALIREVLAIRYRRAESLSFKTEIDLIQQQGIAALEQVEANCPGLSFEERRALRRALAERHYCYGSYLLSSGARPQARRTFDTALQLDSSHWRAWAKRNFSFLPTSAFRSFTQLKSKRHWRTRPADSARA